MGDLISYAIESAVAVGTIGATLVAVYQLRRDHRERLARELADRVYVPMREVAIKWQNPEEFPSFPTNWRSLEASIPYLTARVPRELTKLFEQAGSIEREITLYNRAVYDLINSQTLGSKKQLSPTLVRIMRGNEPLGEVNMMNLWKSGKTLEQYVKDSVAQTYPLIREWRLDLMADVDDASGVGTVRQRLGETRDAIDYAETLLKFLSSKVGAVTFQQRYRELAMVGAKAQARIEKELRKAVAPMGSGPAPEPGSPFG